MIRGELAKILQKPKALWWARKKEVIMKKVLLLVSVFSFLSVLRADYCGFCPTGSKKCNSKDGKATCYIANTEVSCDKGLKVLTYPSGNTLKLRPCVKGSNVSLEQMPGTYTETCQDCSIKNGELTCNCYYTDWLSKKKLVKSSLSLSAWDGTTEIQNSRCNSFGSFGLKVGEC